MVEKPSVTSEEANDSRLLHSAVKEQSSSSYEKFHSENGVDNAEPELINEDHPSYCTANPSPPSMSMLNIHVLNILLTWP